MQSSQTHENMYTKYIELINDIEADEKLFTSYKKNKKILSNLIRIQPKYITEPDYANGYFEKLRYMFKFPILSGCHMQSDDYSLLDLDEMIIGSDQKLNLNGRDFIGTNFKSTTFINVSFNYCSFIDSNLQNTSFLHCNFNGCTFYKAYLKNTKFPVNVLENRLITSHFLNNYKVRSGNNNNNVNNNNNNINNNNNNVNNNVNNQNATVDETNYIIIVKSNNEPDEIENNNDENYQNNPNYDENEYNDEDENDDDDDDSE